ncbi:MAG: hypothetical protein ABH865_07315 [Candidatus Omnitrophota bacterium]
MDFREETEDERLLRSMRISPKKKMEWLYAMHRMMLKVWTKKQREIYFRLREDKNF